MFNLWKGKSFTHEGYVLNRKEKLQFFLQNPGWIKYYPAWRKTKIIRNNNPQATTLDIGLPWFTYGAITWLKKYLKPNMKVFEYGTGGSTLFFLKHSARVHAVEHNKDWFLKINQKIRRYGKTRKSIRLVQPTYTKGLKKNFVYKSEVFEEYKDYSFEKYVLTINRFDDKYFDLVVVDGRARPACLEIATKKIKQGGYLLLDNSERFAYKKMMVKLKKYKRSDFLGFGPYLNAFWQTTVWKIT